MKVAVVIPTKNRLQELSVLLKAVSQQSMRPEHVIVVDSSETDIIQVHLNIAFPWVTYIHSEIASAAIQRNLGLHFIQRFSPDVVAFLDDDVIPDPSYLELVIKHFLHDEDIIGVSGLALNPAETLEERPITILINFIKVMFCLGSRRQGRLLLSGVPIPLAPQCGRITEVEWLIGCSNYDFKKIQDIRFEEDFLGYSLGEDVIFSYLVSKRGRLIVDPKIRLVHTESKTNRPNQYEYWRKWMRFRWRLVQLRQENKFVFPAFLWSSMGQLLLNFLKLIQLRRSSWDGVKGILSGIVDIARIRYDN